MGIFWGKNVPDIKVSFEITKYYTTKDRGFSDYLLIAKRKNVLSVICILLEIQNLKNHQVF
jgi:hypothetical protein